MQIDESDFASGLLLEKNLTTAVLVWLWRRIVLADAKRFARIPYQIIGKTVISSFGNHRSGRHFLVLLVVYTIYELSPFYLNEMGFAVVTETMIKSRGWLDLSNILIDYHHP